MQLFQIQNTLGSSAKHKTLQGTLVICCQSIAANTMILLSEVEQDETGCVRYYQPRGHPPQYCVLWIWSELHLRRRLLKLVGCHSFQAVGIGHVLVANYELGIVWSLGCHAGLLAVGASTRSASASMMFSVTQITTPVVPALLMMGVRRPLTSAGVSV